MTWFKVDDQFPRHPKVIRAGTDAAWLFVAGGCYCAQYLTDGMIPKDAVAGLTALRQPLKLAGRLVEVGLWHDRGDAFEVHDYLVYNPSREKVEKDREEAAERRRNGGQRSAERRATVDQRSGAPVPVPDVPNGTRRRASPSMDFAPTDEHRVYATEHGLSLEDERVRWVTHCEANGKTYQRLNAGFTTWLHHAVDFGRGRVQPDPPSIDFESPNGRRCERCAETGGWLETIVEVPGGRPESVRELCTHALHGESGDQQ